MFHDERHLRTRERREQLQRLLDQARFVSTNSENSNAKRSSGSSSKRLYNRPPTWTCVSAAIFCSHSTTCDNLRKGAALNGIQIVELVLSQRAVAA